eukprot:Tamp_36807.p2 GENE.Tamp_36807~~Tamp_36807.p2  ORF type:complete len:104 (+),score=16.01 Tamp_36807:29-313(+)
MFAALTLYTSPPYPTFAARPPPAAGRCALRHCSEQFSSSPGFRLDSGVSGNIVAVGNAGKPCAITRVCDNFGHCHTRAVCEVLQAKPCGTSMTL